MSLSIFPEGIDTFVEHYDIQPADLPNIRRYQELKQKSYLSVEEQNELSNLTHVLREKIFLADDFNKLQDCITNLETFFRDETQGYLDKFQEDIKNTADATLDEIIKVGEDFINSSEHHYTSWVTAPNQSEFNILEGTEEIDEDTELDFREEILDLFLNGDMLLPERDYTFELADNGKKQVIKLSTDLSSTLVAGQRMVAKWFQNVGKLYIDHSHEHKAGGKDELIVDMNMLAEDVRLAIGDTTQIDNVVEELQQVRQDLSGKSDKGHKHTKAEITDFPTNLPANGGNADTVDGKHASDFASSSHNHNGVYAPVNHSHGNYAPTDHTHTQYANASHSHTIANISGLQGEIDNLKSSVSNGKKAVADAITSKGVSTSATTDFTTMANNIKKISTGMSASQKKASLDKILKATSAVRAIQTIPKANLDWQLSIMNSSNREYAFFISRNAQSSYPSVTNGTRISQGSANDWDDGCNYAIYKKNDGVAWMDFSGSREGDWAETDAQPLYNYFFGG